MRSKLFIVVYLILALAGLVSAATYYLTFKSESYVVDNHITISPKNHEFNISAGGYHIKQIEISNNGNDRDIYFEYTVEGPSPDKVHVSFHRQNGTKISSSNKLHIKNGETVSVNVHYSVDDDAEKGKYTIYIEIRE